MGQIDPAKADEFIRLWRSCGGKTADIAKATGTTLRAVMGRRKRIEETFGIKLDAQKTALRENAQTTLESGSVVAKFSITDGVILVGGDAHYWPGYASTAHRGLVHLAGLLKPKAMVMNGDAFDGASISRWPSIGWEGKPDVQRELEAVQERLGEIEEALPKGCKKFWPAGNHDLRFETRLAMVASEYRGVKGIHLKDHFPGWFPCWLVEVNGGTPDHVEIRHREKGGIHAGYRNTVDGGVTIVTGHDHRADVVPFSDRRGLRYGVRAGMLADSSRDPQFVNYLEGRTANWQSGFAVLTFKAGRLLMPELCLRWDDNHVQFRGELIRV